MRFEVYGEFRISITPGRRIDRELMDAFWSEVNITTVGLSAAIGCYVFGVRPSGGQRITPWYVGKTMRGFEFECFQSHKIIRYEDALHKYKRGRAMMFLIPKCTKTGEFATGGSSKPVDLLEKYLIGLALKTNPDLRNARDTKMYRELYVPGLVNAGQGNPGAGAQSLKRSLGI